MREIHFISITMWSNASRDTVIFTQIICFCWLWCSLYLSLSPFQSRLRLLYYSRVSSFFSSDRFFYCGNQFICKIECGGPRYECKRQRKKDSIEWQYSWNMQLSQEIWHVEERHHTHAHTFELQKNTNYKSVAMTPLECCLFWICDYVKWIFARIAQPFWTLSLNSGGVGCGGRNGKKVSLSAKMKICLLIVLAFVPHSLKSFK